MPFEPLMPLDEAELVREAYANANVILEFGSGGSTSLAAQLPGRTILSVESDRTWAHELSERLAAEAPLSMPLIHYVDIGPVGKWGKPVSALHWSDFYRYPLAPWSVPGFSSPDVVLIDGRFRAACFLSVCVNCKKPTRILFDDYMERDSYHIVERFFKPTRMVGRMAEFNVAPLTIEPSKFQDLLAAFFQVSYAKGQADPDSSLAIQTNFAQQSKIKRLRQQRRVLMAPYIVAFSPVLLPAALGILLHRWLRRKGKSTGPSRGPSRGPNPTKNTPHGLPVRFTQYELSQSVELTSSKIGLNRLKDEFVLYRIIGNDLEPRHAVGQSINNLSFILEHEGELAGCRKKWVVNRIYDPTQENKILQLMKDYRQDFIRIPFDFDEYAQIPLDFSQFSNGRKFFQGAGFNRLDEATQLRARLQTYRLRNNYVMHNNGARNIALTTGRAEAKWVMPWDGNCFIPQSSWVDIRRAVRSHDQMKYFTVPMARMTDNQILQSDTGSSNANEEPQILFRDDAKEAFDEAHPYGRRPKVDLLMRLGVPGPWDRWKSDPWDLSISETSGEANFVGCAGWVARLSSGKAPLDAGGSTVSKLRTLVRGRSILLTLQRLDDEVLRRRANWYRREVVSRHSGASSA